jgi:uncharacterized protein (DUF3820 family)
MKPLTDTCPMPFGRYKDEPMQDVPASWLHWFWSECREYLGTDTKQGQVLDYIQSNLSALKQEYPDGIWS